MHEVYQERLKTTKTIPCMEHIQNPDNRILNIAQMHNTVHLAPFRIATMHHSHKEELQILEASALPKESRS